MKYAIYDKATNAYLTIMEFDTEVPDNYTRYALGYNEYITKARLLDTKEEAADVVTRIEGFKFMEKGRFVIHSFDDTLNDQYIISEAGNPTKVVDNITVDLCGTINIKYGTMMLHWSATSLNDVIDRMNSLQKAASTIYTSWNDTFDIYKVINIIDEKGHTHYQFINVTAECLEKYSKDEEEKLLVAGKEITDITDLLNKRIEELEKTNCVLTDSVNYHNERRVTLANVIRAIKYAIYNYKDNNKCANYISYMTDKIKNDEIFNSPELKTTKNDISKICKHLTILSKDSSNKRIEELEKANYELGEQVAERGAVANRLLDENNNLKAKVESIKKEACNWKNLYTNVDGECNALKNVIDNIYDDLHSDDMCKDLKDTYDYVHNFSKLHNIKIHNDNDDTGMPIYITANVEFRCIIDKIIKILESRELNKKYCTYASKAIANNIIDICEATTDPFEVTIKKFSQLYEAVNDPSDDDDVITFAFKGVLEIFSSLEDHVRGIIDESVTLKHKAMKAEKALDNQKKLNDANKATIAQMVNVKRAMNKELSDAADALKEVNDKNDALSDMLREITDYVGDIMFATRTVDRDKMISDLRSISCKMGAKTADDGPIYGISIILNTLIINAKEVTDWKNHADKVADYCINDVESTTEIQKFTSIRNSLSEVIFAIRNAIYHNDSDAFRCIENRMKFDPDFNSDPFMAGVRENIKDICSAEKRNIANHELKNDEIAKLADKIKKLKSQFNSMYGYYDTDDAINYCLHDVMITGGRCCGKQLMADILSGKKIPISKDKYDSILTTLKLIDLSYEGVYGTTIRISPKPKPTWLPGLITEIKNLTK